LPMLEALLLEFQLNSQEIKENGSSIKLIIWLPHKLETTLISWDLSEPQDQINTLRLVSKTWWERNPNIDGESNIAIPVNKSQIFKTLIPTTETDNQVSSKTTFKPHNERVIQPDTIYWHQNK
jgi:hypothetical protein